MASLSIKVVAARAGEPGRQHQHAVFPPELVARASTATRRAA